MKLGRKVHLVQAFTGAVVLTLLMQPMALIGYGSYTWLLFLPLLLFFALGAQYKNIPSMIVCFACGEIWAVLNGLLMTVLNNIMPSMASGIVGAIIIIFCLLTVHENFLAKTIFGNVPALFLGMAETFFTYMIKPANAPALTPFHLFGFFLYGLVLSVALVGGGFLVCSLIFGKEKTVAVFTGKEE